MAASPIADLSYRGYEGELESPGFRWWVIARMSVRLALKKKAFWIFTSLGGGYLLFMILMIFVFEQFSAAGGPQAEQGLRRFIAGIVWKDQFLHAFSFGQMWFLFIALLVGAGSIANDNRANALLVYLSKPCTKTDYLLGKWMGIFLPLCIAMAIPSAVFWLYGALSYRPYGFLSSDPWVIVKVALLIPFEAALYASLVVFFSSLSKQGRIAGAAFVGLFFLSNFFTKLMQGAWFASQGFGEGGTGPDELVRLSGIISKLFYCSVDGLGIALGKAFLGTDGSMPGGMPFPVRSVPAPSVWAVVPIALAISALCTWVAWKRVRAVEVVG